MKMKRLLVWSLVVGLVLCFGQSASQTTAFAQDKINIAWGGSSPGGVMYYMVGVAGTIISRELPHYNITQVSTGGSTENTKRLLKGELDMGISYGAHVYLARNQEGPFKGFPKGDMLMGVTKAYAGPTYFITRPTTGIKKIADLKGKTVAAFDTSYKMSWWLNHFTAAKRLMQKLCKLGGKSIAPPETFHVKEREGPLYDGEIERANRWASSLINGAKPCAN